jgi:glycosyltransferase involved in cell wall biosynthesis
MRITLLTEIPAPFRNPLFSALAEMPDVELDVLFLSLNDPRRPHYRLYETELSFPWRALRGRSVLRGGTWLMLNRGVLRALRQTRPEIVVVGGWNQPAFWLAALWVKLRRRRLVVWVESTANDARSGHRPLEFAKRWFARHSDAVLVPGRLSAEFVRALGTSAERIHVAPNAIDATIFGERVAERRTGRAQLRGERGLEGPVILYVGRLDGEKGLDVLLRSMWTVTATLVLAGSGTLAGELEAGAPANVRFLGAVEREELVNWYAAADVFVLPSRSEPWGMVLNEAAAAGLPIVATDAVGAAYELVEDGANGFIVPAGDEYALAASLQRLVEDEDLRGRAGQRSLEVSERFTPDAWATAVAATGRALL